MDEKELKKTLSRMKEKFRPAEDLPQRILSNLDIGKNKGRLSNYQLIFNQIHNLMKWKIIVPLAVVVLAIIIFGGVYVIDYRNSKIYNPNPNSGAEKVVVPSPEPTADINGVVDAIFDFSVAESNLFDDEEKDAALIGIDNKVISDFGQSYDENEL